MIDIVLGQVLSFAGNPMLEGVGAACHEPYGAVAMKNGKIIAHGPADVILTAYPQARITDYGREQRIAGAKAMQKAISMLNVFYSGETRHGGIEAMRDRIANIDPAEVAGK